MITAIATALLFVLAVGTSAHGDDESVPAGATGGKDSLAVETRADSVAAETGSDDADREIDVTDPVQAWRQWKSIGRAVTLRKLDGPEDILAKEEIIADRIDDLTEEDARLHKTAAEWEARYNASSVKLEVLDDLAEMQLGGDLQLQQRIDDVREQIREDADWQMRIAASRLELATEIERLKQLGGDYRQTAEDLRRREEGNR